MVAYRWFTFREGKEKEEKNSEGRVYTAPSFPYSFPNFPAFSFGACRTTAAVHQFAWRHSWRVQRTLGWIRTTGTQLLLFGRRNWHNNLSTWSKAKGYKFIEASLHHQDMKCRKTRKIHGKTTLCQFAALRICCRFSSHRGHIQHRRKRHPSNRRHSSVRVFVVFASSCPRGRVQEWRGAPEGECALFAVHGVSTLHGT